MNYATQGLVYLMTVIVSGALLALIVSRKSNAPQFISSTGNAFSSLLNKALTP